MQMKRLIAITLATCCAMPVHAQSAIDSGFHSHYPQHYFFDRYSPPAPSAEGRFGFESGEDRGYGNQYLREENYEHSHGMPGAQADCEFSSCPCPSPYYRNSTNCAPVVIPPRPDPPNDPCTHGICEMNPNNSEPD